MECYVGMDVSLKETSICVVNDKGEIVSEGTVTSEPEAIAAFIKTKAKGAKRIGLETGPTTTWLWHELRFAPLAFVLGQFSALLGSEPALSVFEYSDMSASRPRLSRFSQAQISCGLNPASSGKGHGHSVSHGIATRPSASFPVMENPVSWHGVYNRPCCMERRPAECRLRGQAV